MVTTTAATRPTFWQTQQKDWTLGLALNKESQKIKHCRYLTRLSRTFLFSFDIRKLGGGTVQSYYRVSIRDGTSTEYLSDQSGINGGTLFADDSTLGTKTFSLTNLSTISNSITSASQITFRLELGVNGTGSTPDRRLAFDNVALLSIDNDTVPEPSSFVAISLLAAALINGRSRGKS